MSDINSEIELKKTHRIALRQQISRQNEVIQDLIQMAKSFLENEAYSDAEYVLGIVKKLDQALVDTEKVASEIDKELLQ